MHSQDGLPFLQPGMRLSIISSRIVEIHVNGFALSNAFQAAMLAKIHLMVCLLLHNA